MTEYINRESVIRAIENDCLEAVYYTKRDAIDCIEAEPSADVVEMVRCKDCWYGRYDDYNGCYYCQKLRTWCNGEFYCAYGKKENGR